MICDVTDKYGEFWTFPSQKQDPVFIKRDYN
jgi:hypothetical protein